MPGDRRRHFGGSEHGGGDRVDGAAIAAEALERKGVVKKPHRLSRRNKTDRARRHEQIGLEIAVGRHDRHQWRSGVDRTAD
jgi:hypothetical protein